MADVTFSQQLGNFATRVGTECLTLHTIIGKLTDLSTTDKASIVAAINEIKSASSALSNSLNALSSRMNTAEAGISTNTGNIATIQSAIQSLQGSLSALESTVDDLEVAFSSASEINDTTTANNRTWSSSKILTELTNTKNDILGGAGEAFDSLKELADLLQSSKSEIDALKALAAGHVKYDAAQTLTDTQKSQARSNIAAASSADMTSIQTRMSSVETKATTNATNHTTLSNNIGDTATDFVAIFESALEGS